MASSSTVSAALDFDFVRFVYVDIHGISKCKSVPKRHLPKYMENGVGCFCGAHCLGPRGEVALDLKYLNDWNLGNMVIRPADETVYPVPWAEPGHKIGEIMCETECLDGTPHEANTRYMARQQLKRLKEKGINIFSGFEAEFIMTHANDLNKRATDGYDFTATLNLSAHEAMLYSMDDKLIASGIDVETYQTEYAPGQFEMAIQPVFGIRSADNTFRFKEGMKEMARERGMNVTFMCRPFTDGVNNGFHYNHSLWREDGTNAFFDAGKGGKLSELARHWVAGLTAHALAMAAICCPTVNCYRRMHTTWAPHRADWGIENRNATFRVKVDGEKGTYVENRMPSGPCNPYLVLAATIAAGLDGVDRKLELPAEYSGDEPLMPDTLAQAVAALEVDKHFREALGEDFMAWFVPLKKRFELEKFGNHNMKEHKQEEIDAERHEYLTFL